ncbi:MAG: efflux RND transporter periplasmic adaptor subunit [Pseudomonadota bacterium]|nr:efflux RND transporter periplasmic adaptor subunit [Pseudomonadota bacterium]
MVLRVRPRRRTVLISVIGVLVAVAIGIMLGHIGGITTAAAAAAAVPVPVPVAHQDANVLRFAPGAEQLAMIQSRRIAMTPLPLTDVLSARLAYDDDVTARVGVSIGGRITAIHAATGDKVRAGQVLADIDSPDLGTAAADLDKARADEHRKQLVAERATELVPGDAIAQKDWEGMQADLAQAKAETARASQRVKNLNPTGLPIAGQRLKLVSPVAGVVTERNVTPGLEVNAALAAPMFVISDTARLWAMIDLPEQWLGQVKTGARVTLESDAWPGETFDATIVGLGQLVDPNTRRVTVRALVDNSSHKLLPEMFARVRLLAASGAGVAVPNSAIVNRGRYAYVFVQTGPQQFTRRQITLATQGGDTSYVASGLAGGDAIVTAGALLLDAELTARADAQ